MKLFTRLLTHFWFNICHQRLSVFNFEGLSKFNFAMKILISILFAGAMLVAPSVQDNINAAFKIGNAATLQQYFSANIDLTVNENESVYSAAQAGQILKSFFEKHVPSAFKTNHQGNSQDGSAYVIGSLTTNAGTYQVYYYLKPSNNTMLIHKLRIVAENE